MVGSEGGPPNSPQTFEPPLVFSELKCYLLVKPVKTYKLLERKKMEENGRQVIGYLRFNFSSYNVTGKLKEPFSMISYFGLT